MFYIVARMRYHTLLEDSLVIIPVYNEERTIEGVINDLLGKGFKRILVVNDGSTDPTLSLVSKHPVRVINHIINMGYGSALRTGFECAIKWGFKYVITFDADGQMRAEDAARILYESINNNWNYTHGCRDFNYPGVPRTRKFMGILADILTFLLSGKYVKDTQSGLRCINVGLLRKFNLRSIGFSIPSELVIESIRNGEVPKPVTIKAIYTKESLKKGQKISNSFKVVKELLGVI